MFAGEMGLLNWGLTAVVAIGAAAVVGYLVVGLVRNGFGKRVAAFGIPVVATCLVIALFLYGYVGSR